MKTATAVMNAHERVLNDMARGKITESLGGRLLYGLNALRQGIHEERKLAIEERRTKLYEERFAELEATLAMIESGRLGLRDYRPPIEAERVQSLAWVRDAS